MKNAPLLIFTIVGTLLGVGCGTNDKPEKNAFVPVTGHDLDQLSQRLAALESRMRETQTLLVNSQNEGKELRRRLQVIETRFMATAAGARPSVSQPAPATATPHHGNDEKETPKRVRH